MKLNVLNLSSAIRPRTHEGAPALAASPELALRRSVLACMLWELHDQRGQREVWRGLWRLVAHRRLEQGSRGVHPRTGAHRRPVGKRAGEIPARSFV